MKRKQLLSAAIILLCLSVFLFLMLRSTRRITLETAAPVRTLPPVLIDPGHGGEDGGAVSGDVLEKHINLAVSHDVADLLRLCGYTVSMTRDTDDALTNEGEDVRKRKYNDMKMRLDLYNATPDNVVVSIHQNKFDAAASHGAQVFYSPNHPNSAVLAEALRKSVTGMLQPDNTRTCKTAGKEIFLLKNARVPAVIVECGFISNRQERELLVTDDYQKQLALAIAAGLMNYVNTN
ncbi:MAG: N-acetylmuramoyl-L-alanine amidase [Ruminococcus sp.]|jgi:N-acetylmuramoyl-L-alanine amidase|nr:N-acetylmuramoyl-L-alanine amidase [Ruminococcus sp.]MBQ1309370.1 N-acetylmuramoyl-L-alanine amidase [Ruminococcus sp.]MBQ1380683.1 N-acetylmuramoyl-L-alanine amidase [Ruminococcus sp.]MBQ1601523.1 N-acetylmuramoyl-L-alanine amidase [Ruminococcus sp.]MBQ1687119.1 N-acetylmuramoyl-L-alanine amidase [Ruminococcus sp.]